MKITTFISDFTSSKVPKSPFGNKEFEFTTKDLNLEQTLEIMRNEFYLNRNYIINETSTMRRSKFHLREYLNDKLEFVIVDFDRVKTKYAQNMIINYFKENDYYVGVIPSRSHNGVDNFNLKAILKARGTNNRASILGVLREMNETLFPYCKIDLTSTNEGAYQAPSFSKGITLLQEGKYIPTYRLKDIERIHIELNLGETHNKVIDACIAEYSLRGFSISNINEERGLITFFHPSEVTPNGYFMFISNPFYMNHFNKDRSFNVFDSVKNDKDVKDYFEAVRRKERETELSGVGSSQKTKIINSRYIKVGNSETDFINEWLDSDGLFKLKSAMGTGKSNVIDKVIEESDRRGLKVLLVTNRISVAKDFQSKYDIKLYSDGKYEMGDDLIVQFDSLWRYSLKHFDVIILDEFVSIMLHSRNSMGEYGNLNKVKLMYAMRTKLCMVADAFLYGVEDNLIPTKPKYSLVNEYREKLKLYEYPDIGTIINNIRTTIESERKLGRKVTISCTTKSLAKAIETMCENDGFKTLVLSADTLEIEKSDIYEIFELETHDAWDVFIYTPTLTVGLSILNNVKFHFHIDESMTADVISSLQMTKRSRKAEEIHYFVKERKRYLETDVETLNNEVRDNIELYYKKSNSLLIEIDKYGDFVLSEVGRFMNEVEVIYNKLENDHKHSFQLLMKHQSNQLINFVAEEKHTVNINDVKKENKRLEIISMKETLRNLSDVEYDSDTMEEFSQRNHIVGNKQKMQKLMSEINKSLKDGTSKKILKEITEMEITKGFKYLTKLKRLKFYLSKNEADVKSLMSYIVSENTLDKSGQTYFKYVIQLKKSGIKLKNKITLNEIEKVNSKIGFGDFRAFLVKIGYVKRGGIHILNSEFLEFTKFLK